jgi:glyoxylase-like metal-dependent hydrolase (beta-lactamase superfamily II)
MKLTDRIYMVASGKLGRNQTSDWDCNVYLIDCGSSLLLIDSGSGLGTDVVLGLIAGHGFRPADIGHIVVTHGHADHSGGARLLAERTGARIVCSPATARILREGDEAAIGLPEAIAAGVYPPDYAWKPAWPALELNDGEELAVGDVTVRIVETPGHSHDLIAVYMPELKALFSSDTVFAGGRIAALDAPDFNMAALADSIRKLAGLGADGLFPGHLDPIPSGGGTAVLEAAEKFARGRAPSSIV